MKARARLALVVMLVVEAFVVVLSTYWLRTYFDPPPAVGQAQRAFAVRYPAVQMPAEFAQIALSFVLIYALLAALAGNARGRRLVERLLPVAALAAVALAAFDANALYSFHTVMDALVQSGGPAAAGLASVNDSVLHIGVVMMVSLTVLRLATYAFARWSLRETA